MIKFLYRLLYHIAIFFMVLLPLEIIGWLVLLPVCKYQGTNTNHLSQRLPACLKWFDNADYYVDRDTSTYDAVCQSGWWNRYCWLAWRNPINYFGYVVLGLRVIEPLVLIDKIGNQSVSDNGTTGLYYAEYEMDSKVYYEYYYIHKWSATKCLRFRMGHKIG